MVYPSGYWARNCCCSFWFVINPNISFSLVSVLFPVEVVEGTVFECSTTYCRRIGPYPVEIASKQTSSDKSKRRTQCVVAVLSHNQIPKTARATIADNHNVPPIQLCGCPTIV